jgi:hypothetical protein
MSEAPNAKIGGCIALDNSGKPYSFSGLEHYLEAITIVSPLGEKIVVSKNNNTLFYSTLGGEGLTGIIVEAEFTPIKVTKKININLKFKPNDFYSLQNFWSKIISLRCEYITITRSVSFPLGLLQIRALSEQENRLKLFENKVCLLVKGASQLKIINNNIPIGEMIIHQVAIKLKVKYKLFSAISNINYQDQLLNDILSKYVKENQSTINQITSLKIGNMVIHKNPKVAFNGRIPSWTDIEQKISFPLSTNIINYGGSNINGGSHIAFLGNDLNEIKHHAIRIFDRLHKAFPHGSINEHRASLFRGHQILSMEGKQGLSSRIKIRAIIDPNKIMYTSALQDIDTVIKNGEIL